MLTLAITGYGNGYITSNNPNPFLSSYFLTIATCDIKYIKQLIYGHRFVATSNPDVILWGTDRPSVFGDV